jgi:hypothetical protein
MVVMLADQQLHQLAAGFKRGVALAILALEFRGLASPDRCIFHLRAHSSATKG